MEPPIHHENRGVSAATFLRILFGLAACLLAACVPLIGCYVYWAIPWLQEGAHTVPLFVSTAAAGIVILLAGIATIFGGWPAD